MPPRQFRLAVSENYKPRNNLDVPTINRLLKELKFGHKNVRSSQKQLFTEMHLLERVYYKGKNQHGLSLFWRSVASVRRMAARVYETNLPRLLEILGSMFHEEPFEGQKVFNGAWTRMPPPENIAQILERLVNIGSLLKAAIIAFQKAYRALCLAMFNTAFLQLTIVLVGIVSRNNALASALLDNLSSIIPCVHAVFEVLEPHQSLLRRLSKLLKKFSLESVSSDPKDQLSLPEPKTSEPQTSAALYIDDEDEDLGLTIARGTSLAEPPTLAMEVPNHLPSPSPPHMKALDSPASSSVDVETTMPLSPPSQLPRSTEIVPVEAEAPAGRAALVTTVPISAIPRDARMAVTMPKPKKKRKKVRDEIDAIFG